MARATVVVLALISAGCGLAEPDHGIEETAPAALLDYNRFVCGVQPVLIRRCSFSACHGNPLHALRIYSAGKLRLIPPTTRDARDATLTADEIERNFVSAAALSLAATADDRANAVLSRLPLLQKPLAARFGGSEHAGVGIFPVYPAATPEEDPEYGALIDWIAGNPQPQPFEADCADLFATLGIEPR